jgi:phosphopantothenoylcysteine decarboxylase / phosphopantothenate---cysteine ligase
MLKNKKIVVGVSGSISAYKSAFLIRLLVKQGADVRVIMTPDAVSFISPLTLSTLSKNPVYSNYYDAKTGEWHNHVELALWADLLLVAPATANTIAKMANGICDNLLLAVWLSAKSKVIIAPAMDLDMYQHPTLKKNLDYLMAIGVEVIDAENGELASGLVGEGRLAEPESIVQYINQLYVEQDLLGKIALVNAGPTYEHLDPVRYIGNHSSGKMGIAIAEELAKRGATVHLVLGPTNIRPTNQAIHVYDAISADDMLANCIALFEQSNIAVLSAAVADYKPIVKSDQKIKKQTDHLSIELVKTPDILATLGKMKNSSQLLVGFALETENELENARNKLVRKNLDFIVLNSMQDKDAGFGKDTNKITIIDNSEKVLQFATKSKKMVAADIVDHIIKKLK